MTSFITIGMPELIDNEAAYLIKSRQIADPEFIANDWSMGISAERTHGILFSAAVAPLWMLDLQPVQVAMTVRVIQTFFLLFSAIMLLRALGVSLAPGIIGLALWVISGQIAVAGEWVLGGAEQKPFAYGFVLLALSAAIDRRWKLMGIYLSIATWLHILIGAWAAVVMYPSALISERLTNFWKIAASGVFALILVGPVAYLALQESLSATGSYTPVAPYTSVADLTINFRAPHHLDPTFFFNPRDIALHVLAGISLVSAILFAGFSDHSRRLLLATVVGLTLVATAGILAHLFSLYSILAFYPFRVPDGLLPLLSFLLSPYLLYGIVRWPQLTSQISQACVVGCLIAIALFATIQYEKVSYRLTRSANAWQDDHSDSDDRDRAALYDWIRENTAPNTVFLAPPWWKDFRLIAGRPVYVMVKTVPNNDMAWEWYRRLVVANASRSFDEIGFSIYEQLRHNYPTIDAEALCETTGTAGVRYFISTELRDDLRAQLAFSNGAGFVYTMQPIDD